MRGLKQSTYYQLPLISDVASFTDAWIETSSNRITILCITGKVASFTDAWIETSGGTDKRSTPLSRIFYRCVDWNSCVACIFAQGEVASFTDAWIETAKQHRDYICPFVASFTDAWIETCWKWRNPLWEKSRIFYRCVDWNYEQAKNLFLRKEVASFTDAWIETSFRARM